MSITETIAKDIDGRLFDPLNELHSAMSAAAAAMIEKHQASGNTDAYALACLLQIFDRSVQNIMDNSAAIADMSYTVRLGRKD